jgi:hypothetical protein
MKTELELLMQRLSDVPKAPSRPADDIAARALLDALWAWNAPCPFAPGDLVYPRKDSFWKPSLGPCIVLRLDDSLTEKVGTSDHGVTTYDMRVLALADNGLVYEAAVHSRDFERYTGVVA